MGIVGFPEVALVAQALHLKKDVIESNLRTKGNVRGFNSKIPFDKGSYMPSMLFSLSLFMG